MSYFDWKCEVCDRVLDIAWDDDRMHSVEHCSKVVACVCGGKHVFTGDDGLMPHSVMEGGIDHVKFDYVFQIWRKLDATPVKEEEEWEFPCDKCNGPAKMDRYDAHGEYYTCSCCGQSFKVD